MLYLYVHQLAIRTTPCVAKGIIIRVEAHHYCWKHWWWNGNRDAAASSSAGNRGGGGVGGGGGGASRLAIRTTWQLPIAIVGRH